MVATLSMAPIRRSFRTQRRRAFSVSLFFYQDCLNTDSHIARSRINGYINNVHPIINRAFYNEMESLIDNLLPIFNRTIIDLKAPGYRNQLIHLVRFGRTPFIDREPGPFRPPEQRTFEKWRNQKGQYKSSSFVDLKKEFWNIGLQMVLHVRVISLTPLNPSHAGEEWHVEGQTVLYLNSFTSLYTFPPQPISSREV